jgi:hypothetical protein
VHAVGRVFISFDPNVRATLIEDLPHCRDRTLMLVALALPGEGQRTRPAGVIPRRRPDGSGGPVGGRGSRGRGCHPRVAGRERGPHTQGAIHMDRPDPRQRPVQTSGAEEGPSGCPTPGSGPSRRPALTGGHPAVRRQAAARPDVRR